MRESSIKKEKKEMVKLQPLIDSYQDDLNDDAIKQSSFFYRDGERKKEIFKRMNVMSKYSFYIKENFLPVVKEQDENKSD